MTFITLALFWWNRTADLCSTLWVKVAWF